MLKKSRPKKKILKLIAIASLIYVAGVLFAAFILFHLLPLSLFESVLSSSFQKRGMQLSAVSFGRTFPAGFDFKGVRLYDNKGAELIAIDEARVELVWSKIRIKGSSGEGSFVVDISPWPGSHFIDVDARSIDFASIPALKAAGADIKGAFDARAALTVGGECPSGSLRLTGVRMDKAEIRLLGVPLPVGKLDEAGASMELRDCKIDVRGVWIEGDDVSARLQGVVTMARPFSDSALDLKLEIVPQGELLQKEYLLSFLSRYRLSANYYSVPISGTVAAPAIR